MTLIEPDTPTRKRSLAPDLRTLDERAARAWTERMAVRPLDDGRYAVDAESGATYVVDLLDRSCTCPDNRIRGEHCKHLRRVAIEITAHRVAPPGKTLALCDACGTETFVDADASPPHLCGACRLEPGDVVVDRESLRRTDGERTDGQPPTGGTGDRLVVRAVTDRRADEVTVGDGDRTVADYPTNEGYPSDDLVVEATYLSDAGRDRTRDRRYSFPLSRLEPADDAALIE